MKEVFTLLLVICTLSTMLAQTSQDYLKVIPEINETTPEWAVKMYAPNPNVHEVVRLFQEYYQDNPFEKTTHTQNFKHWIRHIETYVMEDGYLNFPDQAEMNAYIEQKKLEYEQQNSSLNISGSENGWVPMGPFATYEAGTNPPELQKGHKCIYSIAYSASNPDLVICGTQSGGIYKSEDKGENWSPMGQEYFIIKDNEAVAIHPTNEDVFFVKGASNRFWRSTDRGNTWVQLQNMSATEIKFHPTNPDTMFIAAGDGLFRSDDLGDTWTNILPGAWCPDVDFHPTNPDTMYVLRRDDTNIRDVVYRSDDGGNTWNIKDNGYYAGGVGAAGGKIALTSADPNVVYVCLIGNHKSGDNGWIGVYKSDDKGESWADTDGQDGGPYGPTNGTAPWNVAAYSANGGQQGFYNFDLEASQTDPNKIWVGTIRLSESTDGGATFTSIGGHASQRLENVHVDIQDIEVRGSEVWVATDGGVNYSNDELQTAKIQHRGIDAAEFWGFNTGWNEDVFTGGRYHNGNAAYHENYGLGNAIRVGGVEEPTGYVNPLNNRKVYYSNTSITEPSTIPESLTGSLIRHHNFIGIFERIQTGWSSGLYFDPRYADHLILGRQEKIYKSTDGGFTFNVLYSFPVDTRVYEIEIARSNPEVMYCVLGTGPSQWDIRQIWKTTDGGFSWNRIDPDFPGNNTKLFITLNPADENDFWVAQFSPTSTSSVYRTLDGGTTWIDMDGSIGSTLKIQDIVFQGGTDDLVYIATNNWPKYWDQSVGDWVEYGTGLPLITNSLRISPFYRDGELRLGTRGRGVWARDMADTLFTPVAQPMTYNDTIFCQGDTVQFDCYSILKHSGASWNWSFSPAPQYISSTSARNPKVVFGSEDSYDVTLTVTDRQGNTDSKTISNMVTVLQKCEPDTIAGNTLSLDGDESTYVRMAPLELTTNTLTISAWIKQDGYLDIGGIVHHRKSNISSMGLSVWQNKLMASWNSAGGFTFQSNHEILEDKWIHVAMVVTPDSITIYMNGVPETYYASISPYTINVVKQMTIGADLLQTNRRFKGEIDEVCVWNRSLSQDEVRELRHLTKENVVNDPTMLYYHQFNELSGDRLFDKSGNGNTGEMKGNAVIATSSAPVGGGTSNRLTVDASGTYIFNGTGVEMTFPSSGIYPDGDLVVSRINSQPNVIPNINNLDYYWIVNNYGNNNTFSALDEIKFIPNDGNNPSATAIADPTTVELFKRSDNEHLNSWAFLCHPASVTGGTNGYFAFDSSCNLTNFSQFLITSPEQALPVELLTFKASLLKNETSVRLDWTTVSEVNTKYYEVQHSENGLNFTTIGNVLPHSSNNTETHDYNLVHQKPITGINYYRLKIVDLDGSFEYSHIDVVSIQSGNRLPVVYPNPVSNQETLYINLGADIKGRIHIHNESGKLVRDIIMKQTVNQISIGDLAKGIYFYTIETDKKIWMGKLIIM